MKWFRRDPGCCDADNTITSAVMPRIVRTKDNPALVRKRAFMVWHVKDDKRFWHWSDQEVQPTP